MSSGDITTLLNEWLAGDEEAKNSLFEVIYPELHRIADMYLRRERPNHSLQATALVNEAYLKVQQYHPDKWQSRAHFYAVCARAMRQILVDHARKHITDKEGGKYQKVPMEEGQEFADKHSQYYVTLIEIDMAIDKLSNENSQASYVVQLKEFFGMTAKEIAETLDTSESTVNRSLAFAKIWLERELSSTQFGSFK